MATKVFFYCILYHLLVFLHVLGAAADDWKIGSSCRTPPFDSMKLVLAVREAKNIAEYAIHRITNDPEHNIGEEDLEQIVDLLGQDGDRWLLDRMQRIVRLIGTQLREDDPPPRVTIKCGDEFLQFARRSNTGSYWFDNELGLGFHMVGTEPGVGPCASAQGGDDKLLGAHYQDDPGTRHGIILCGGQTPGTLSSGRDYFIGERWRTVHWTGTRWEDINEVYASTTLLHEFLHVVGLPRILPSSRNLEVYTWDEMRDLNEEDEKDNAETYAVLATALWLAYYELDRGQMGDRHDIENRPTLDGHMWN